VGGGPFGRWQGEAGVLGLAGRRLAAIGNGRGLHQLANVAAQGEPGLSLKPAVATFFRSAPLSRYAGYSQLPLLLVFVDHFAVNQIEIQFAINPLPDLHRLQQIEWIFARASEI
jgi:hypothetical protein